MLGHIPLSRAEWKPARFSICRGFPFRNAARASWLSCMASEKQKHSAQEILQAVEDALVRAGYSDYIVVTERGSFHWMTVERARERQAEDEAHQQHTRH
jgi:hypothetical protein